MVSEKKIFYAFPIISICQIMTPQGVACMFLRGMVGRSGRSYKDDFFIHCYTQNMKALGLVVLKKIFYVLPIVSPWELYVAMETKVLIRRGLLTYHNISPNDASDKTL